VSAYDSFNNGGAASERAKLVSVDSWGTVGFTNMANAFNEAIHLTSVPASSDGLEGMFAYAEAFDQDIRGWNTANVTDTGLMFSQATAFNQDIGDWNTANVTDMSRVFWDATSFNQDLAGWCVSRIPSTPQMFAAGATSWVLPKPAWGACPGGAPRDVSLWPDREDRRSQGKYLVPRIWDMHVRFWSEKHPWE
jgi:surface protein